MFENHSSPNKLEVKNNLCETKFVIFHLETKINPQRIISPSFNKKKCSKGYGRIETETRRE